LIVRRTYLKRKKCKNRLVNSDCNGDRFYNVLNDSLRWFSQHSTVEFLMHCTMSGKPSDHWLNLSEEKYFGWEKLREVIIDKNSQHLSMFMFSVLIQEMGYLQALIIALLLFAESGLITRNNVSPSDLNYLKSLVDKRLELVKNNYRTFNNEYLQNNLPFMYNKFQFVHHVMVLPDESHSPEDSRDFNFEQMAEYFDTFLCSLLHSFQPKVERIHYKKDWRHLARELRNLPKKKNSRYSYIFYVFGHGDKTSTGPHARDRKGAIRRHTLLKCIDNWCRVRKLRGIVILSDCHGHNYNPRFLTNITVHPVTSSQCKQAIFVNGYNISLVHCVISLLLDNLEII
jgi:hypothetical protein